MKTNLIEYYKIKYGINIRDANQPLLIQTENENQTFIVPELCYEASLGKDFTKDAFKMRKLQEYKLNNPTDRFSRINTLIEKFQQTEALEMWGIKVNANFQGVKAKTLHNALLVDERGQTVEWEQYEKSRTRLT
jgi:hypothetical protein